MGWQLKITRGKGQGGGTQKENTTKNKGIQHLKLLSWNVHNIVFIILNLKKIVW